jgi:hypothetical protein
VTSVHADIDALKGLHEALVRYRLAQREVAGRGDDAITVARASLEAKASRCRAELEHDETGQSGERLEQIRRWQQRIDAEASEFQGLAGRFRDLLENDLPRTEQHLLAIIAILEAARRVQAPGS